MPVKTALVVEDNAEVGQWCSSALSHAFPAIDTSVCRTLSRAKDYLTCQQPELVLLDIKLPDGNGLDLLESIHQVSPDAKVVVTTVFDDEKLIFTAFQGGADGYLLKGLTEEQFISKLQGLLAGEPPLSPRVARMVLKHFSRPDQEKAQSPAELPDSQTAATGLSEREREVLILISKGLSRREVARLLELSENTIATHIRHVYRKLDISSRAEATLEACRLGLVTVEE